jgi:hypothetical protein
MPCRCCNAGKPSQGFINPEEQEINEVLKLVAKLIYRAGKQRGDDLEDWNKSWIEAFSHHLRGCPEGASS